MEITKTGKECGTIKINSGFVECKANLSGMPSEIFLYILSFVGFKEIGRVAQVCKDFNAGIKQNKMFKKVFEKEVERAFNGGEKLKDVAGEIKEMNGAARGGIGSVDVYRYLKLQDESNGSIWHNKMRVLQEFQLRVLPLVFHIGDEELILSVLGKWEVCYRELWEQWDIGLLFGEAARIPWENGNFEVYDKVGEEAGQGAKRRKIDDGLDVKVKKLIQWAKWLDTHWKREIEYARPSKGDVDRGFYTVWGMKCLLLIGVLFYLKRKKGCDRFGAFFGSKVALRQFSLGDFIYMFFNEVSHNLKGAELVGVNFLRRIVDFCIEIRFFEVDLYEITKRVFLKEEMNAEVKLKYLEVLREFYSAMVEESFNKGNYIFKDVRAMWNVLGVYGMSFIFQKGGDELIGELLGGWYRVIEEYYASMQFVRTLIGSDDWNDSIAGGKEKFFIDNIGFKEREDNFTGVGVNKQVLFLVKFYCWLENLDDLTDEQGENVDLNLGLIRQVGKRFTLTVIMYLLAKGKGSVDNMVFKEMVKVEEFYFFKANAIDNYENPRRYVETVLLVRLKTFFRMVLQGISLGIPGTVEEKMREGISEIINAEPANMQGNMG